VTQPSISSARATTRLLVDPRLHLETLATFKLSFFLRFMQHSPNRLTTKKSNKQAVANQSHQKSAQHVSSSLLSNQLLRNSLHGDNNSTLVRGDGRQSILHRFPYETLCHITSYLDPGSLLQLSDVDKYFKEYTSHDVVWKLALFANVLDIRPEYETKSTRAFLLRRIEKTWKQEYIKRYEILA
jgi:hypothetical protein